MCRSVISFAALFCSFLLFSATIAMPARLELEALSTIEAGNTERPKRFTGSEDNINEQMAKIMIAIAFGKMPVGHGIDLDNLEKRSYRNSDEQLGDRSKRFTYFEERMNELRDRIKLALLFNDTPVGHGAFDVENLYKRSKPSFNESQNKIIDLVKDLFSRN